MFVVTAGLQFSQCTIKVQLTTAVAPNAATNA